MEVVSTRCCECCGFEIPAERLEVLPNTLTCVGCSTVKAKIGFLCFNHKTGGIPIMVDPDDKETLRLATRAHKRSR